MWNNSKFIVLLLVFVLTGAGVLLTRWLNDAKTLAHIRLVVHDGQMVEGGLQGLEEELRTGGYAVVFYEGALHGYNLPFAGTLRADNWLALQKDTNLHWVDISPDTLFLRAWTRSYSMMMYRLPADQTAALNAAKAKLAANRRMAVLTKGLSKTDLLHAMHAEMDVWTDGKSQQLRKRYANELLNQMNRELLRQPDKRWLLLVDVEHYLPVRTALSKVKRIALDE
jgi:hypothetical protein